MKVSPGFFTEINFQDTSCQIRLIKEAPRIKTTEDTANLWFDFTEFWYENLRRPVALFLSWDFIEAYAMPHIFKTRSMFRAQFGASSV
jgi:hypothetical protein